MASKKTNKNNKPKRNKEDSLYKTYSEHFDRLKKNTFMRGKKLSKAEFLQSASMYKSIAKAKLKDDPNDPTAMRILKNIGRTIAYDQKDISPAQMAALKKGAAQLKLKDFRATKARELGLEKTKDLIFGMGYELQEVFDIGSP